MHSAPSGPSFTERLTAALYRALRPVHGRRVLVRPRLAGVLLGSVVIGLLVATLPMASTAPDAPASVALNGSSAPEAGGAQDTQAHRSDVVEMGVDGAPAATATSSAAVPTDAAPVGAPLPAAVPAATVPGSASSSVAAPAGSSTASTPAASPVLPQPPVALPPVTVPPVTVPPVTTNPSPSPTTTDASPSPSPTTDPTPTP